MRRPIALAAVVLLALLVSLAGTGPILPATAANGTSLTVALYPWVPRLNQFQTAITTEWSKVQPSVSLNFLPASAWDGGYSNDPPANADVYVFDAMFFEYFRSKNWLDPLNPSEVSNLNDFVQYALDGVKVGSVYYSIPQLGCANILFYQKADTALVNATTLSAVNTALSQCTYTSQIPPDRRGLMIDMAGGTTNAALYLDTAHSLNGQYPFPLPWNQSQVNASAVGNMRKMLAMASWENGVTDTKGPYDRSAWFSTTGRAVVGYTESMWAMSDAMRQNIGFKVMPLSDTPGRPLFYADVIAVNPTSRQRGTRTLAVQLANVMAASATMVASIGPGSGSPTPQYLMAARPSVFQALGRSFPLYNEMYALVTSNNPLMFKVSDQSRAWLTAMASTLRTDARQNFACGCDYPAAQAIPSNAAAPPICQAACASYGGWNGQWTNQGPAAPPGTSVCGCRACPAP